MKYSQDLVQRSNEIIRQIKDAEKLNKPIEKLVKEQITIMECQKDEFLKQAEQLGLDELERARVEIQIYSNIKFWVKKIGLPVEKYDELIKNVQIRIFGEENYKRFFEDQ